MGIYILLIYIYNIWFKREQEEEIQGGEIQIEEIQGREIQGGEIQEREIQRGQKNVIEL